MKQKNEAKKEINKLKSNIKEMLDLDEVKPRLNGSESNLIRVEWLSN
jgi:hypothetical protein